MLLKPRAGTPRPSRSSARRWRSPSRRWARRTRPTRSALTTSRCCSRPRAGYAEAEPLYREALAITGTALGKAHPDYAIRLNNLAGLLATTGRTAEAEPLFREALAITETALGKAHPDYAISLNNLAALLAETGRSAEAESLYREALEIPTAALGADPSVGAGGRPGPSSHVSRWFTDGGGARH